MTSFNSKAKHLSVDTATDVTSAKNNTKADIRYQFNFERFWSIWLMYRLALLH